MFVHLLLVCNNCY